MENNKLQGQETPTEETEENYDFYKPYDAGDGSFASERAKLKKMGFRDRVEYLWNNYTAQIFFILIAVFVVIMLISSLYSRLQPAPYLTIALLDYDSYADSIEAEDIMTEDGSTDHVTVETFQGMSAETIASGESYQQVIGITALITAGDLDGLIGSEETIRLLQKESADLFYDLGEVLSTEELTGLQDRLLYMQDSTGRQYPVAIRICDMTALATEADVTEDMYIVFPFNSENGDRLRDWIFDELKGE
jgi:hypothetical protein